MSLVKFDISTLLGPVLIRRVGSPNNSSLYENRLPYNGPFQSQVYGPGNYSTTLTWATFAPNASVVWSSDVIVNVVPWRNAHHDNAGNNKRNEDQHDDICNSEPIDLRLRSSRRNAIWPSLDIDWYKLTLLECDHELWIANFTSFDPVSNLYWQMLVDQHPNFTSFQDQCCPDQEDEDDEESPSASITNSQLLLLSPGHTYYFAVATTFTLSQPARYSFSVRPFGEVYPTWQSCSVPIPDSGYLCGT